MLSWSEYIPIFTAILVIVNPIGAVPIFIGLTHDQTYKEQKYTARLAALSVAIILIVAALTGEAMLGFFGISIGAFRVGGGILLLLMALTMIHAKQSPAKHSPEEAEEAEQKENVAVVPLATPLMAGPAAISTVVIYSHKAEGLFNLSFIIISCLVTALIVWISLRLAGPIANLLGKTGINIVNRIMGLLLTAIAVQFIAEGIKMMFPSIQ